MRRITESEALEWLLLSRDEPPRRSRRPLVYCESFVPVPVHYDCSQLIAEVTWRE